MWEDYSFKNSFNKMLCTPNTFVMLQDLKKFKLHKIFKPRDIEDKDFEKLFE